VTRTGPQRYPGADQTHRYQDRYGGDAMEVNVVVLHTTEGRTLPDYNGGADAPNLTAVPDFGAQKLTWHQHFDIDVSSRALVNLAGGVETNTLNVCQVELVGTCDPATHTRWGSAPHIYWPEAPEWALAEVAKFLAWMHDEHGVPLTGPALWLPYPASYGATTARMTGAAWDAFTGVCGHQHVPENLHGDPGAIDFARLITLAKGTTTTETDMPLTTADVKTLTKTDNVLSSPDGAKDPKGNAYWTVESYLKYGYLQDRETNSLVKQLAAQSTAEQATIAELVKTVAALAANTAAIDPDALVARIQGAIENVTIHLDTTP
jgi:hypothetical protein